MRIAHKPSAIDEEKATQTEKKSHESEMGHVDAMPSSAGADLGDPSQQFLDLRAPSRLI